MSQRKIFFLRNLAAFLVWMGVCISLPVSGMSQNSERELFLVAQKAFEDGFYDVAIRYIQQLQRDYPQTKRRIESNLLLGQCYFFKSHYLKAYEIFHDLLRYSEFKDATLFWLGETYLKGSDHKQAAEQYDQVIRNYPKSVYAPQAYYSLGWVFYEQTQHKKAKDIFTRFVEAFPDHQLSEDAMFKLGEIQYNLQSYEEAIHYFEKYTFSYPKSTRQAEAYFYIGESYYYMEDFLTAVTYYAKAAQQADDSKLALMAKVSLGWSYLKLDKLKLAQQHFDDAYQLAQEKNILSDDVLLGQANLYTQMKEYNQALAFYSQLIQQFPDSKRLAESYLGKANIHYMMEDHAKALESYQRVVALFSKIPERADIVEKAYFGSAWAYLKLNDIDAAVKNFEIIKEKSPSKTVKISALTQIGDAYQDVGRFAKAIEVYDKILDQYSKNPYTDYVQYRQGIALLKMGNIEAATLSFQSLQANFPTSRYLGDVSYYLAVAHFKKGDWAGARGQINRFIASNPQKNEFVTESEYILALSSFNLLDYEKALKTFQRILKNYPEQSDMIKNSEIGIAKCYYKMGQTKEALKRFEDLAQKYPQTVVAQDSLIWLGDHCLESQAFDLAIAYYVQFLEQFPGSEKLGLVYFELGQAYQAKGEVDKAVDIFRKIDQAAQPELYAKARLAIADIFSRELDPERALETYQNIIETSSEFKRDAYVKIAEIFKKDGRYQESLAAFRNALDAKGGLGEWKDSQLQFYVGDLYELLNERERAVEEYLKLPYLYAGDIPWVVKSYLRIARIFEDNEQWGQAQTVYQKVLTYKTDELKFAQERLDWIKENMPR